MSGMTYEVVQSNGRAIVTIYKNSPDVREKVAEIIGRPVAKRDFPTGQPVIVELDDPEGEN